VTPWSTVDNLLIKSPEVGRMVPADHPVNGQVFTKAPPTGPADIRVTFTRWNDQYLSCQPVPDQLLPGLTADLDFKLRALREQKVLSAERAGMLTSTYQPAVATFATGTPVSNTMSEMW